MKQPGELSSAAAEAFGMLRERGLETGEAQFWLATAQLPDSAIQIAARTLASALVAIQLEPPNFERAQDSLNGLAGFCMYASVESSPHGMLPVLN